LAESVDVRKLLASFLEKDDRPREPKPALKEPGFMDNVLPRAFVSAGRLVLCCQDEEGDSRMVEHL